MTLPHPIVKLLQEDDRYSVEAYSFVRDALSFGQHVLGYGEEHSPGEDDDVDDDVDDDDAASPFLAAMEEEVDDPPRVERHLTGQQLCEAIRLYALEQYGYMAKVVLNSWGLTTTGDFGEIVYNLIRIGMMKKSESDRREDFDDCYDFDEAFQQRYKITMAKEQRLGRRKQRGSRETVTAKERAAAMDRHPHSSAAPAARPPLPPAHPPRRNVPLLIFSIALFLVWLVVLIVLANYR